jgi:uncharacterized protein YutE (UPF0331/DUF86 family)
MSDIDLAISHCKKLESLLEKQLGATGKGLHEKVSSVENRLTPELIRNLRLVATVRNKIVHESDYQKIDDRKRFVKAASDSEKQLRAMGRGKRKISRLVIPIIIVVLLVLAWIAYWKFR